ncbi:hypothetical protein ACAX43_29935 [Paraburkholderia sp. IW21]|uniref:hypothetical protein n=1 Tax=Paraburkholderia sp. IW21 TaxID=3242488 RepID=UPI003522E3C5
MQTPHNFWLRIIATMHIIALSQKLFICRCGLRRRTCSRDVQPDRICPHELIFLQQHRQPVDGLKDLQAAESKQKKCFGRSTEKV